LGDWLNAWPEYEWRLQTEEFPRCPFPQPRWDGSPLAGRTLLVLAEQGLGDTFQFLRFVVSVRQRGERVIFQCQPALLSLLAECLGRADLFAQGSQLPEFDVYSPLLSLPGVLGTVPTTVPAPVPYMRAWAYLVDYWRHELAACGVRCSTCDVNTLPAEQLPRTTHHTPRIKIGIAWQGTPKFRGDRQRSIPLEQFARLAQVPGVQLISLQKGPGTEQLSVVGCQLSDNRPLTTDNSRVLDLGARLDEASGAFMDTAAVMINLDLVISSDTAVPHLAGALGVPVWVALALAPDWRWLLKLEDSPWYPTMRLFRQSSYGDWEDVFKRMTDEIKKWATDQTRMEHG
jgi:hypothetical protein